ncbi:MAG: hypothetical protein A3J71_13270 [Pseudomonadales bacterium RIFCSPHIGHO2_02_FULL_60_43]|nr:MAG: hypothetical protein A3J71_13270 [Pseudomonadales bacterium RIFCSPHIGHO2_02_FULL_60_43]
MNIDELISTIEEAFGGVLQPQGITLHVAEAHDNYDYEHDEQHRQKDFMGRWQDVPIEHIEKCQAALSFVDRVGMKFYLPAYMIWFLKNFGTSTILTDHTLYSLDNHAQDKQLAEYHRERFSLFTAEQLRACALFVKFCANDSTHFTDTYFAQKSYERYWARYEEI